MYIPFQAMYIISISVYLSFIYNFMYFNAVLKLSFYLIKYMNNKRVVDDNINKFYKNVLHP